MRGVSGEMRIRNVGESEGLGEWLSCTKINGFLGFYIVHGAWVGLKTIKVMYCM